MAAEVRGEDGEAQVVQDMVFRTGVAVRVGLDQEAAQHRREVLDERLLCIGHR